jgi:hypothetical protein
LINSNTVFWHFKEKQHVSSTLPIRLLAAPCLFDWTSPIYSAGESGNENTVVFTKMAAKLKNKGTSITNV